MTLLHQLLKNKGIKLTIGIYPWPSNIYHNDYPSRHSTIWRNWAFKEGVDIIDLFPKFINSENPIEIISKNFVAGDIHWNRNGHDIVASAFLDYFAKITR